MIYILHDILIVSSFKISFIFSLYIGILAAHMYVPWCAEPTNRVWGPLELELHLSVSHQMNSGNKTLILCKNVKCS